MGRRGIGAGLVLALVAAVYAGKVGHPFQWDDFHFLARNRFAHDAANLPAFFTTDQENLYRPLRAVVYLALHRLARGNPVPYHLAGIAFHLATCLLVMAIAGRVLRDRRLGLLAGALFGVHPVVADRVANVTGSLDIPGVTLTLLALWLFLRAGEEEGARRRRLAAGSLAAFALGLLYSEEAVTLWPLVVLFARNRGAASGAPSSAERSGAPARGGPWLAALRESVLYAAVLAVYLVARTLVLRGVARAPMGWDAHLDLLFSMGVVFWTYVLHLLVPLRLSAAYGPVPADPSAAAAALLLTALVVLATVALLRGRSRLGLALAWFLAALVPFSNLVPIGEAMADRYAYHAAAGFAAALVGAVAWLLGPERKRTAAAICVLVAAASVLTIGRVRVWASPISLWGDAVAHAPTSYAARINHGIALRAVDPARAREEFEAAVALDPSRPLAYVNLGQLLLERGEFAAGAQAFVRALQRDPEHVAAMVGLANAMVVAGDLAGAGELARRAAAIDGENASVHNVLAFLAYKDGRLDDAAREYEIVLREATDPRLAEGARANLQRLRGRGAGRP